MWFLKELEWRDKRIGELEKELDGLKHIIENPTAKGIVIQLTNNDFKFYDYHNLDEISLKNYHDQAQSILKTEVFKNEVNHLNAEFAEWAAKQSRDFNGVEAMRHQISGINLLKELLESIPDPTNKQKESQDPYSGI